MAVIVVTVTLANNTVADANDVMSNFNTIVNDYNNNITNANISTSAAIAMSKLAQKAGGFNEATSSSGITTTSATLVDMTGITVTYTPVATSNFILLMYDLYLENTGAGNTMGAELTVGGSAQVLTDTNVVAASSGVGYSVGSHYMVNAPANASRTDKVQWKTNAGTATADRATFVALEIRF